MRLHERHSIVARSVDDGRHEDRRYIKTMASLLDQLQVFEDGAPAECFSELVATFPKRHVGELLRAGFRFYQTTFWYPLDEPPKNVFESVISHLRPLAEPSSLVTGVEWWFSVLRINTTPQWILPCHFDRSDLREKDAAKRLYPEKGSVLFMNSVPYGELVVTDQVCTKQGIEPKQPKEMRFVRPRMNRYVVFPGQLYHGVIGRMWRPAEQRRTLRIALAVNWWYERPKAAYLRDSRECLTALRLA